MAEVLLAQHRGFQGFEKFVVVKRILPQYSEDLDFVTMLVDEAKIAASLNHPNIVHIYDLGTVEGSYYIAMEYIEGRDLHSLLRTARKREQPLELQHSIFIISEVCKALFYAHHLKDAFSREQHIIHRDVSPSNILISYDGTVKLVDFGIARAESKISVTKVGTVKGKFPYLSPEQADGKAIDYRSDIYALGCVLYESLVGKRIFNDEDDREKLRKIREGLIPSFRDFGLPHPPEVERIIRKAMARNPADRYQTANEMRFDLVRFLAERFPAYTNHSLAVYMNSLFEKDAEKLREKIAGLLHQAQAHGLDHPTELDTGIRTGPHGGVTSAPAVGVGGAVHPPTGVASAMDRHAPQGAHVPLGVTVGRGVANAQGPINPSQIEAAFQGLPGVRPGETVPDSTLSRVGFDPHAPGVTRPDAANFFGTVGGDPSVVSGPTGPNPVPASGSAPREGGLGKASFAAARRSVSEVLGGVGAARGSTGPRKPAVRPGEDFVPTGELSPDIAQNSPSIVLAPRRVPMLTVALAGAIGALMAAWLYSEWRSYHAPGEIVVNSVPAGAHIVLDGKPTGLTTLAVLPLVDRHVPHEIRLELARHDAISRPIQFEPGELRLTVNEKLAPTFGDLHITSEPEGAEVILNGKPIGFTPYLLPERPHGERLAIRLKKAGFQPWVGEASIARGQTVEVGVQLEPAEQPKRR